MFYLFYLNSLGQEEQVVMSEFNQKEIEKILEYHREFFESNITKNINFRIKKLIALKKGIKKYEKELMDALYTDLGKHKDESFITEFGPIYSSISYMIKNLRRWAKPEKKKTPIYLKPGRSYVEKEPYGTVLILGAFNYPIQLIIEPLIGAIAAGNTVVIKTSEMATNTSGAIRKMLDDTFEKKYVLCVEGDKDTAEILVNSKFDYIFFTGSAHIGKLVMEAAAKNLIPLTLELGGKCPVIVDKEANIGQAAKRIAWGKFLNAGQTCVAPDYVLVHEDIEDEFVNRIKTSIFKYYGDDIEKNNSFGRIINERHFNRVVNLLESERENIVFGGHSSRDNKYIEPTILKIQDVESPIMEEEIFGPVLPIIVYDELDNAIKLIKKLQKPLALYIFTKNKNIRNTILNNVSAGTVCINDTILQLANNSLPFGGVGNSGMGSYHGWYSFDTFSHKRGVLEKNPRVTNPIIYPPYSNRKNKIIRKFLK
ncbi:MAG: aldehyde dehydrogenase [Aminipila sp.]